MDYIEISITELGDFDPGIIIAGLGDLEFESFSETDDEIQCYIREELFREGEILIYLNALKLSHGIKFSINKIAAQNWNSLWESAYEPVTIGTKCRVRAPFHDPLPGFTYDIVIEPKMSFGTAHHETTSLMIEFLLKEEVEGKRVLDMGCGTGVLAILASMMGANTVVAIDNDDWAYENSLENVQRNKCPNIEVIQGDAATIPGPGYDLIIANINRNVLVNDIPRYETHLTHDGTLLLSGFYEEDLMQINAAATNAGLHFTGYRVENKWVGAKYTK